MTGRHSSQVRQFGIDISAACSEEHLCHAEISYRTLPKQVSGSSKPRVYYYLNCALDDQVGQSAGGRFYFDEYNRAVGKRLVVALVVVTICVIDSGCAVYHVYGEGGAEGREQGNQPGTEGNSKTLHNFGWVQ